MQQPLLTVIIPCYNVEKYVDKCISSIVAQTYSNLEILLIEDGSTDTTGKICDAWQKKDKRVRVIHKQQNEGLPYARKTGIEHATGEYVTFVDADDWIGIEMYTDMMTALLSTDSDIASCDVCRVYEDGRIVHRIEKHDGSIKTMGRIEGINHIFEGSLWNICFWNKIYKKNLFKHIEFKKERSFSEDIIIYKLYHNALQTVYVNNAYCFYFQRNDSICRIKSIPAEQNKIREWSEALYEAYCFLERYPEYHSVSNFLKQKYLICVSVRLLHLMIACPQQFTSEYFSYKTKQLRSIPLGKGDWIPRKAKIELYLLKISPILYKILRMFYNRVIQFTNRLKITNKRTYIFINESGFYWSTRKQK